MTGILESFIGAEQSVVQARSIPSQLKADFNAV
jgi:hypothetical protein